MGHKINPKLLRLGITHDWDSKWYAGKQSFKKLFHQDLEIQKLLKKKVEQEGVAKVEILRTQGKVIINIHTAKPGLIIGRGGESIEKLKEDLHTKFKENFAINIKEIKKPMLEARVVADMIARQIERRISYRRAAKMALDKIMESGAQGAKIYVGGRLNGVEISRSEFFNKGSVPLHTLRANIDYHSEAANTTYGKIGVKVWIYKGQIFKKDLFMKIAQEIEELKTA